MNSSIKYQIPIIFIFCFITFVCIYSATAQSRHDSLLLELGKANHDTTKIKVLFKLGNLYIDGPSDSLLYYYNQALELIDRAYYKIDFSNKHNTKLITTYKNFRFRAILEIGIENFFQGNYNQSLENYHKALEIATEINDKELISEVYSALGIVYKNQGEYALALEYYEKALATAIELQDTSWIAACYANAGNVYRRLTNYTKALDYFLKALKVFEQKGETRRMAISYMNIGNLHEDQNDFKTALEYFSRALQLSYGTNDKKRISECLMNIGNIYSGEEEYDIARDYYRQSFAINEEMGFEHIIDDCYKYIGNTYEKEGNYEKAIENYNKSYNIAKKENDKLTTAEILGNLSNIYLQKKDYPKSLEYANKSLKISLETGDPQNIKNAYLYLSLVWECLDNYPKALEYYKSYAIFKDSIFSSEKYKSVKDLEMKYETEKKEDQLALLTEKNEVQLLRMSQRNRLFISVLIVVALIFIIGYILFRNRELKAKHKSVELEQRLLRSQMNPHFIFNSLIAIQSYIYKKDPVKAGDFLAKFADLVRMTLENSRVEFILFEKEINTLQVYLALQSIRFENKFTYSIEVDKNIDEDNLRIPPMFTQPFIENAIEHGLRHKPEAGFIKLYYVKSNNHILCTIEDNGVGREKAKELEKKKQHQSLAIDITKERLDILNKRYKQKFMLDITDLKNETGIPCGTKIEIRVPYTG